MTSTDKAMLHTTLERGAGVAVWRQIEQILAAEIASGAFGEGA
jgi:GntR family phosphonate transport system transcriptional regulator